MASIVTRRQRFHRLAPHPAALEVGTADAPIPSGHTALIRLTYVKGLDPQSCPAIVACGGRMDLHGAPIAKTWGQARSHQ